MKSLQIAISLALCFLGTGCIKAPFFYPQSESTEKKLPKEANALNVIINGFNDAREDKDIDDILKASPFDTMQVILKNELASMPCIKSVELKSNESQMDPDLFLNITIKELKWQVPDYGDIVAGSMGAGLAFGLIGGLAYSSQETSVNGIIVMSYEIKDSNSVLIRKTADEIITIHENLMNCDTKKTKARVVGLVFEKAIQWIKQDLINIVKKKTAHL